MSRSITGTLPEPAIVLVEQLEKAAKKNGIHIEGDGSFGNAKGKGFHVKYHVEGDQCTVVVTKKPLLIPWAIVESALAKIFAAD